MVSPGEQMMDLAYDQHLGRRPAAESRAHAA